MYQNEKAMTSRFLSLLSAMLFFLFVNPHISAQEGVEKPGQPEEQDGQAKEPAVQKRDLSGKENLDSLLRICEVRKKAYEGVAYEKSHMITTRHFYIQCNSTEEIAKRYAWVLEKLYNKYRSVFAAFSPLERKCRIRITRNFSDFNKLRKDASIRELCGYYSPGSHSVSTYHGAQGYLGNMDTVAILARATCYHFLDLILPRYSNAPNWVRVGIALLMEDAEITEKGRVKVKGLSAPRLALLQHKGKAAQLTPLAELVSLKDEEFGPVREAQAVSFTWWLLKGAGSNKYALLYNDYLKIATGGTTSKDALLRPRAIRKGDFEKTCGVHDTTLADLEKEWKKWLQEQKPARPGKTVGYQFVCDEHGFVVTIPGSEWTVSKENVCANEVCVMASKSVKGRITVSVMGTCGRPDMSDFWKHLDEIRKKRKLQKFRLISRKKRKYMGELEGWESILEYADSNSPVTRELRKYRIAAVSMVDRIYMITGMSHPDDFDELQPHFDKVVKSFRLDAEKLKEIVPEPSEKDGEK
jgi:hypothetical protein